MLTAAELDALPPLTVIKVWSDQSRYYDGPAVLIKIDGAYNHWVIPGEETRWYENGHDLLTTKDGDVPVNRIEIVSIPSPAG